MFPVVGRSKNQRRVGKTEGFHLVQQRPNLCIDDGVEVGVKVDIFLVGAPKGNAPRGHSSLGSWLVVPVRILRVIRGKGDLDPVKVVPGVSHPRIVLCYVHVVGIHETRHDAKGFGLWFVSVLVLVIVVVVVFGVVVVFFETVAKVFQKAVIVVGGAPAECFVEAKVIPRIGWLSSLETAVGRRVADVPFFVPFWLVSARSLD